MVIDEAVTLTGSYNCTRRRGELGKPQSGLVSGCRGGLRGGTGTIALPSPFRMAVARTGVARRRQKSASVGVDE